MSIDPFLSGSDDGAVSRLPHPYRSAARPPSAAEYVRLRRESGLSPKTLAQARGALENSWMWLTIRDEIGDLAAMGRVIGDGTWYFHLADIATDPAHQRRGLGRFIVSTLLAAIEEAAEPDPYITLMGDPPGQRLYRSLGFVDAEPSLGMVLRRSSG